MVSWLYTIVSEERFASSFTTEVRRVKKWIVNIEREEGWHQGYWPIRAMG
jgi:hypothetical protein